MPAINNACWSAQMPSKTRMHKPNATIILKIVVNSKNDSEIWIKFSH